METKKQKVQFNGSNQVYWLVVDFTLKAKKSRLLIGVSMEYLRDYFGTIEFSKDELQQFFDKVILKWHILADKTIYGDDFFSQAAYYDVFSVTEAGRENIKNFLINL